MENLFIPEITVFHCINTFADGAGLPLPEGTASFKFYRLPCSGMVKDVFLLRAFEAGADAVIVFVCPEGECRHLQGSIRAARRVQFTRKILDEIEIGATRLALFNLAAGDQQGAVRIIADILPEVMALGPNPAA